MIQIIVQQHVEEVGLLWLRRDRAVNYPDFSLNDLAKLDEQLEAHADGMRIAGDLAWEIAEHELRWQAPGEVFAAALFALEDGNKHRIERVLKVAVGSYGLSRAFISALGWLPFEQARGYIDTLVASKNVLWRRIGIAAAAVHRHDPGPFLAEALRDSETMLLARALKAAGELGRINLLPLVKSHLESEQVDIRFSAAWSSTILSGEDQAIEVLRNIVEQQESQMDRAAQLAVRRMNITSGGAWINHLAENLNLLRAAIRAAAALGDASLIPWLLEQMRVPSLARVAGEAFTMITGVDIVAQNMVNAWPEGFEAGPTEDPADENVLMDEDEHLPWPDRERLVTWWHAERNHFESKQRYLAGMPITKAALHHVLRHGKQRQRAAAAMELAILQPETCLFEVRAPGFRQPALLT